MATLQGLQTFARIANITTTGLVSPADKPLLQSVTDNRCSPAQPSIRMLVFGKSGGAMQVCSPLPDTGSVVTLVSNRFCHEAGIAIRPEPEAPGLFAAKGMPFRTEGIVNFSVQLGEPGKGVRFDI